MTSSDNQIARGALLIGLAMLIIGFIDNYVRLIALDAGLWQFHAVRSVMALALIGAVAWALGRSLRPVRLWAVAVRSLLTATSILLYFGAVASMPVATAGAGLFTSPIWVLVISALFLGMRVGIWRIAAVFVGFAGVLLVLRPGAQGLDPVALIALAAGVFYAAGAIATRRLCAQESPETLLCGFFLAIGLMGASGLLFMAITGTGAALGEGSFFTTAWQSPTPRFLWLTLLQAVGSIVAVFFLVRAYQIADPSYVSVFEFSFLPFAGLWAFGLWREVPDPLAIIGIAAIILAGSTVILRSRG